MSQTATAGGFALDVFTARGREADAVAQAMARALAAQWGYRWQRTRDTPATATAGARWAAVDGVFTCAGRVVAVAECKARTYSRTRLQRDHGDTYLISLSKLERGRDVAALLNVPFVLCAYLRPDATVYWWRVAHPDGSWARPLATARTRTQATVNGGTAWRENAYLPLTAAGSLVLPVRTGSGVFHARRDNVALQLSGG